MKKHVHVGNLRLFSSLSFAAALLGLALLCNAADLIKPSFERIGPFGGDVRSLLVDRNRPDLVYLGSSDGRIFKSNDSGQSWTPLSPGIQRPHYAIDTLVQHPKEPDRLYAGAWDVLSDGGGLFESLDAGASWKPVRLPHSSPSVRDFAICPKYPERMIVGALNGVYVTQDGGLHWRNVSGAFRNVHSVAIGLEDPDLLIAGTWRLAYRSADFGKTWKRIETGMPLDSDIFSVVIDPKANGFVYATACTGAYRSQNLANSWTRLKLLPDRFVVRSQLVYLDPSDSRRLYCGTTEGLFLSGDSGQNWKRITSPQNVINAIQVDPRDSKRIYLGTETNGVLISHDGGRSWNESNLGFSRRQISTILPDSSAVSRFIVGVISTGNSGGFYSYDHPDNRWASLAVSVASGAEVFSIFNLPNGKGQLAGTSQGVYLQKTGSKTWAKLTGYIGKRAVYGFAFEPETKTIIAGTDYGIFTTPEDLLNFIMPPDIRFAPKVFSLAVSPWNSKNVIAATSVGVLHSVNNGKTWRSLSSPGLPGRGGCKSLAMSPAEHNYVLCGASSGLFESRDGGLTWKKGGNGQIAVDVPAVAFLDSSGKKILAADNTLGGIFLSNDGGFSWQKIMHDDFNARIRTIMQDPSNPSAVYLGTASDGVYRMRLP